MSAVRELMEDSGLDISLLSEGRDNGGGDAVVRISIDNKSAKFGVVVRKRTPYPNEIDRLDAVRQRLLSDGVPLLVTRFVTVPLGKRLTAAGWSWIDLEGNMEIRADGLLVSRRETHSRSRQNQRDQRLPGGAASAALIRLLIGWPPDVKLPTVTDLAAKNIGVSQPRVSQILAALGDQGLVHKDGRSWFVTDRGGLLDRYIDGRVEVEHATSYLYTLSPLPQLVRRAIELDEGLLVSADVGPDLIAPWKEPASVILYASIAIRARDLGAVRADSPGAANVLLRSTKESWVHGLPTLSLEWGPVGMPVPLVDPVLMMRDLLELGGTDRVEAAGVLREWIMARNK